MPGTKEQVVERATAEIPFCAEEVSRRLLAWYGRAGRELPWRQTRDPYRIWLSEIMLQQTRVEAVIGYYQRFLERFSSVSALAQASLDEVIDLWAGLGYYARARNLHAAAKQIVGEHQGVFPRRVEELQQLPGIGRSTAGAIAALAFDLRAPILDGNVRRILCRLFAFRQPPRTAAAEKQLWIWTDSLTPETGVHDYTQAIMDLGATLCTPRSPRCEDCPLVDLCQAQALGIAAELPMKTKKKAVPLRRQLALLLERDGRCLVRRRPAEGLLGGLWEFPTLDSQGKPEADILAYCAGRYLAQKVELLGCAEHVYSHFRLEVDLYRVSLDSGISEASGGDAWLPLVELETIALHGAHKKLLPLIGN